MPHVQGEDVMTLDVRKAPSRGGVIIRDSLSRVELFVENTELMTVALKLIDEADKERQRLSRRNAR